MSRHLGFSTGFFWHRGTPYASRLQQIRDAGCDAFELYLDDIAGDPTLLDDRVLELGQRFAYRSLHLPCRFRYPSPGALAFLPVLETLLTSLRPQTVVLHPDLVDDFGWVREALPGSVALENMDWRKATYKSADELAGAFRQLPEAGWVCDVNHVLTNDPSMGLAAELHAAFDGRLVQYHLSGFGSPELLHTLVSDTHEDELFAGITDNTTPVILESVANSDSHSLKEELRYVEEALARGR